MASSWLELWIPLVCFAHAFALLVLAWNSRSLRRVRVLRHLTRAWKQQAAAEGRGAGAAPVDDAHAQSLASTAQASQRAIRQQARAFATPGPVKAVLAWRGVGCSYAVHGPGSTGGRKAVLQDAMGVVCEGQMAALLGPSGGGKSTLLEILAGRKALGELCGRIGLVAASHAHSSPLHGHSPAVLPRTSSRSLTSRDRPASGASGTPMAKYLGQAVCSSDGQVQEDGTAHASVGEVASEPASPDATNGSSGITTSSTDTNTAAEGPRFGKAGATEGDMDCRWLVWKGVRQHATAMKNLAAFVPQDSVFPASLTAGEVLSMYAALLNVDGLEAAPGGGVAQATRKERLHMAVMRALGDVGLSRQADTLVGGPLAGGLVLHGLSGGERRRLSVATGLIAQPRLLVLDEPTTGLDAFAAANLVSHLSALCLGPQALTVVCSIHQPRASIWEAMDMVVVLSQGYTVYSGPRAQLVSHVESTLGHAYQPSRHGSPANWVLDLVNISFDKPKELREDSLTSREQLQQGAAAARKQWAQDHPLLEAEVSVTGSEDRRTASQYLKQVLFCGGCGSPWSDQAMAHSTVVSDDPAHLPHHDAISPAEVARAHGGAGGRAVLVEDAGSAGQMGDEESEGPHRRGAPWWRQVLVLTWREGKLTVNNPMDLAGRMLMFCWAAVVVGLVFYGLPVTIKGIVSRSVVVYVEAIILLLLPFVYTSYYTADRQLFTSELVSGIYRPSAYYVAKASQLTFFSLLNTILFAGIVYGMAGLDPRNVSVLKNTVVASLGYLTAQQVLFFACMLLPNQDTAFMLAILWTAINILAGNYPIRLKEYTMSWFAPVRYASALYYSFSGLLSVQFRNAPLLDCSGGVGDSTVGRLPEYLPRTFPSQIRYVQSLLLSPGQDCRLDLNTVLDYYGVEWGWWVYALLLLGYVLLMHGLTYLALLWVTRKEMR